MSRFQFFTPKELACHCGDCDLGEWSMDARFMHKIVDLRKILNFPFIVSSGIRCPAYNAQVSTTGTTGPHTTGHAIDVRVYGYRAAKLLGLAKQYGMTGIGVSQKGQHAKRFLHLDDLPDKQGQPRPWVWNY